MQRFLNVSRAVQNADNLDVIGQRFVKVENLPEFRYRNEPDSFQAAVFVPNGRSTLGKLRQALKSGLRVLNEPVPKGLPRIDIVVVCQIKLIIAGGKDG